MPVHAAQVEPGYDYHYQDDGDYIPEYANYDLPLDQVDEELTFMTEMCHIAIQKADVMERQSGKCFNCKESLLAGLPETPEGRVSTSARPS